MFMIRGKCACFRAKTVEVSGHLPRVYQGNGEFVQYAIYDAPLEGEIIPSHVLQALFPGSVFAGKRVLVHRDGLFREEEKQVLKEWARRLGADFHLVELLKTGAPRLCGWSPQTQSAQLQLKGSALKLNDHEAFLASSLPPFANATPSPLRIRTEAPFRIEDALHSVLSLTLLHYGSLRAPRLPITIHYSGEIAYLQKIEKKTNCAWALCMPPKTLSAMESLPDNFPLHWLQILHLKPI
jgi:argonaute-like protein implicated in RNA metabolism and viral defense